MTDDLRRLAEGVRFMDEWYVVADLTQEHPEISEADAAYIAAASPDAILALLDRIEELTPLAAASALRDNNRLRAALTALVEAAEEMDDGMTEHGWAIREARAALAEGEGE